MTHYLFPKACAVVGRGVHLFMPGPPGTGKSHMCEQVAYALGREFDVMSFSPMSTTSALIGYKDANGIYHDTAYRRRFEHGGIILFDELDNANPAIVAGLNSGLANCFAEFPDGTVRRHPEFVALATANTFGTGPTAEFAGRQRLDPATLNRFAKMYVGTDEAMENALVGQYLPTRVAQQWLRRVRQVRMAVDALGLRFFVTMRDSINGAKLIAEGDGSFTVDEGLEFTILAIMPDDQRKKVLSWRG